MRVFAICQDELVIRSLDDVLLPSFEVDFLVESRPLARRLHDAGIQAISRRPPPGRHLPQSRHLPQHLFHRRRQRPPERQENALGDPRRRRHADLRPAHRRADGKNAEAARAVMPDVTHMDLAELIRPTLVTELSRSMTRARVQQYQRYFADADRVLILLHNDPDPDALASGLALRNLLRRTKTTAIIGAMQGVTRPENLRMANMLDIHVEQITPASFQEFERIATVDVQPHYFGGPARPRRPGDRPSPRAAGLQRGVQGHPRRLRLDVHDPDRAPARRRRQHLGAHGDGDALRDQVRHAVLRASHQPRRPRGVHVPLSAGRRRADPEDGRGGNHAGAAGATSPARARAGSCASRCSARSSARRRARISSPTPPTSSCSSRT